MARLFDDAASAQLTHDGTAPITALPMTLAGWGNPDAAGLVMMIGGIGGGATGTAYLGRIGLQSTNRALAQCQSGASTASAIGSTPTAINQWQHFAGTFASGSPTVVTVYYNGVSDATGSLALGAFAATRTAIGRTPGNNSAGTRHWSGSIAEVGMWNVLLTADEVAALAKGYSPLLVRPTALRFYAPLVRELLDVRGLPLTVNATSVSDHPRVFAAEGLS